MVPVKGDSMIDAGIHDGDLVVVERTKAAKSGDFVIAIVDDEFTLKELGLEKGKFILKPHNPAYPIIRPQGQLEIFGVWSPASSGATSTGDLRDHITPRGARPSLTGSSFNCRRPASRSGLPAAGQTRSGRLPVARGGLLRGRLSLDEHLIEHQEATFFVRVPGRIP